MLPAEKKYEVLWEIRIKQRETHFEKMCIFSITTSLSKESAIKHNLPFEQASSGCYMRGRSNQVSGLKYKPFCLGTPTFSEREGLFAQNLSEFQKGRTWIQHLPRIFDEKKDNQTQCAPPLVSTTHAAAMWVLSITWAPFCFILEHIVTNAWPEFRDFSALDQAIKYVRSDKGGNHVRLEPWPTDRLTHSKRVVTQ